MKNICLVFLLFVIKTQAQTSQKVWKQFVCDNKNYRVLRISYKGTAATDSIFIQQKTNNNWITDASYFMPSEGAKYRDVNVDGFIDISLQMRFGQVVFIYNAKQKKYTEMGEVGYEGFEKAGNHKNTWYTFIQYKKTHEWWAQLFTIVDGKKIILHELVATPNLSKENDDLYDTKYESIVYKTYISKTPLIKEIFVEKDVDTFFKGKEDERIECKKWLLNKFQLATKKKAL